MVANPKPFVAARIPQELEAALEKHTQSTGESKTTAIINALSQYVGWSESGEKKTSSSDRLSKLEEKVEELEKLIKTPQQLGIESVIEVDNKTDKKQESQKTRKPEKKEKDSEKAKIQNTDNKIDKHIDNNPNLSLLDNHQMAELSNIKYETVRSRAQNKKIIQVDDKQFQPIKLGRKVRWQELDNN